MDTLARQVYIISDLHLGGVYPEAGQSGRGFRINTHVDELTAFVDAVTSKPTSEPTIELIINGDLVDFLAEREPGPENWVPFSPDPAKAAKKMETIAGRDPQFFDALKRLLHKGHTLTILMGNHDIELGLPQVRATLESILDVSGHHDFRLIYDGEAYIVGDALIEHGNRYDAFNVVDNDALRRFRSLQSRRQPVPKKYDFPPPAGSRMVASVINPIKEDYGFIDLLKPETGAVVPVLLALEPGYRKILGTVAKLALAASDHKLEEPALPSFGGDISSDTGGGGGMFGGDMGGFSAALPAAKPKKSAEDLELEKVLDSAIPGGSGDFLEDVSEGDENSERAQLEQIGSDISAGDTISRTMGLARLLFSRNDRNIDKRLPALLQAFRALQGDQSFDRTVETDPGYGEAAKDLSKGGFKYIIFGHTHMAKKIEIADGRFYLNSGTWADLMQFPQEIITGNDAEALPKVKEFIDDLISGNLKPWITFIPTYIRLDIDNDDHVVEAELCDYSGPDQV